MGLLFAVIIILSPHRDSLGELIYNFHAVFFVLILGLTYELGLGETSRYAASVVEYGGSAAIVIFYGGLGAVWGRIQQMANPNWKWLLTALLALFLLFYYTLYII